MIEHLDRLDGHRVVLVAGMLSLVAIVLGAVLVADDVSRQTDVWGVAMMIAAPAMMSMVSAMKATTSAHHAKEANDKADRAADKATATGVTVDLTASTVNAIARGLITRERGRGR